VSPTWDTSEADWEAFALDALGELGWEPVSGSSIAPGTGERESWAELILPGRLRDAIARLNPQLPPSAVDEAVAEVMSAKSRDAFAENHRLHTLITKGIGRLSTPTRTAPSTTRPSRWSTSATRAPTTSSDPGTPGLYRHRAAVLLRRATSP
jgi:hypothetical protein